MKFEKQGLGSSTLFGAKRGNPFPSSVAIPSAEGRFELQVETEQSLSVPGSRLLQLGNEAAAVLLTFFGQSKASQMYLRELRALKTKAGCCYAYLSELQQFLFICPLCVPWEKGSTIKVRMVLERSWCKCSEVAELPCACRGGMRC